MSITILTDVTVSYAGVDLSDHVQKVMIDMSAEQVDTTAMGATAKNNSPGLRNDEIQITFFQDYASGKVDATIVPYTGSATGATIVIKPTSATVSATNPTYTAIMTPFSYHPLDGSVGDASTTDVTFNCVGGSKITRATA